MEAGALDHRNVRSGLDQCHSQCISSHARHGHVGDDQIEIIRSLFEFLRHLGTTGTFFVRIVGGLHAQLADFRQRRLIVNRQNPIRTYEQSGILEVAVKPRPGLDDRFNDP